MKKILVCFIAASLLLFNGLLFQTVNVRAQDNTANTSGEDTTGEGAGFEIQAVLPENQTKQLSYFDLHMLPGQKQRLEVRIRNTTNKSITIQLSVVNGSTNCYGTISYQYSETYDETLVHPFTTLATLPENSVTLAAGETKIVAVDIEMPSDSFDGTILGALTFFKPADEDKKTEKGGMALLNNFAYIVGVVLRETDAQIVPNFELLKVTPEVVNYHPIINFCLRNPCPLIVKSASMELNVYKDGDPTPLYHNKNDQVDFAPNSMMDYELTLGADKLQSGNYRAVVKISYDSKTWDFESSFTVKDDEAVAINKQVIPPPSQPQAWVMPVWMIVVIVVTSLVVIEGIVFVIFKRRKRNKA